MADRVVKVTLRADVADYKKGMDEAARKTATVGTESEKLAQKREAFQALGRGMMVVGGAMTALTVGVLATGVAYNTLQQTSRAALTTLLGSASAAADQMDRLDAFARTSPFSKATFITAQQQMLAFGVESKKVIPYLDAIQDAVAAAGGGNQELSEIAFIMAQISSAGKITGQDLLQFGQRGVNAAELIGSQMGKTGAEIRDEITAGTLDADAALDALAGGMKEKFDGAADNVKQTFSGAMDRVQAAWRDLSADLAKPLVDPNGGGALVDFLNWTADVMRAFQALPEPIKLTGGAMFALAGFITLASGAALAAVPKYVALKESFLALSATMRGIALAGGIAVLALTAIVAVVGAVAASQAAAQAKAEAYADTLAEGTQKVTKATREMAVANLAARDSVLWWENQSAYDEAEKLGVAYDLVTEAAMGDADALKELQKQLEAGQEAHRGSKTEAEAYENNTRNLIDAITGEAGSLEVAIDMAEQKQKATEAGVDASESAADAYMAEADAAGELNDQLSQLIDKINESNDINADAITANANYQSALAGISEEVQKQKDAYEEANGTLDGFNASLDRNTESGSANQSMLTDVAGSARDAAAAQFEVDKSTMSSKDAADKYYSTLQSQRQAFIDSATAAGFNADEVNALADEVFALPSKKDIDVIANTDTAEDKLRRLRDTLASIPGYRSVTLETIEIGNRTATANAAGGLYAGGVKSFAGGGMEPGIYPYRPGGIHKFAEEYAEGYVSMDPRRRAKSEGVWSAIGNHMGFGQSGASSGGSGPVSVSLAGAAFTLMVDGNPVRAIVQEQIVSYDESANRASRGGVRP